MPNHDLSKHASAGLNEKAPVVAQEPAIPPLAEMATTKEGLESGDEEPTNQPAEASFEEGGPMGVRAVVGAWGISFCTWGFAGSWTVFQSYYETSQLSSHTSSEIAWIGSVQICMVYFSSALGGQLFDRGYLRSTLLFSCIASTLGFMMSSISSKYWHYILAQGFLLGIGLGTAFSPALACVSSYYRRRRGIANGLLSAGSAIGGLIIPIFVSKMINNPSIGLGWAHRTCGFVCMVLQGTAFLLMRQKKIQPRAAGAKRRPLVDLSVFKQPAYAYTSAALFFITIGVFYPVFYIQPFAISKGVDEGLVFYSIAILNGVSLIGRILPSLAADRFGAYNTLVVTNIIAAILIYSFAGIQNFGGVAAFSAINGIAYGSYVTINPVVLANLADHPSRIGQHIGTAFFVNGFAALAGPPALGAVITASGGYWQSSLIAGSCLVVATVLLVFGNRLFRKAKRTWRV